MHTESDVSEGGRDWGESVISHHLADLVFQLQAKTSREGGGLLRSVGITSCLPGEGVTTIASNLAIAAAQEIAAPVLLIDANCQHPSLHKVFAIDTQEGLSDVLLDMRGPLEVIVPSPFAHLSLMLPGQLSGLEGAELDDDVAEGALDVLTDVFDLTIVDLPPIGQSTTCNLLASQLDGVLLVIENGRVEKHTAQRACQTLLESATRLLGVVYNKSDGSCSVKAEPRQWANSQRSYVNEHQL